MSSYTFAGLPLHALLVHAVVVLAPLTAVALVLHAFWPAAARRMGIVTPLAALAVLILVPITVNAGHALKDALEPTDAIEKHASLGGLLLPWVIAMFVIAIVWWLWAADAKGVGGRRMAEKGMPYGAVLTIDIGLKVAALAVAAGTIVTVVLIGDAGARAVWGSVVGG